MQARKTESVNSQTDEEFIKMKGYRKRACNSLCDVATFSSSSKRFPADSCLNVLS